MIIPDFVGSGWHKKSSLLGVMEMKIGKFISLVERAWHRIPIWIIVCLAFATFIGLNIAAAFFLKDVSSPEAACRRQCLEVGKEGNLEPIYPEVVTRDMCGRGPVECRCR